MDPTENKSKGKNIPTSVDKPIVEYVQTTHRGTLLEMKRTSEGGIACYMDGAIQSAESDERVYHEALVGPAILSLRDAASSSGSLGLSALILGGGEGATAREILRSSLPFLSVQMIDWDRDVLHLFQTQYPQWAKGAWSDPRLHVQCDDVFSVLSEPCLEPYDLVVIDLFDWDSTPTSVSSWHTLLSHLTRWLSPTGSLVCYMGVESPELSDLLLPHLPWLATHYPTHTITPYSVHVPSFEGSAVFCLLTFRGT